MPENSPVTIAISGGKGGTGKTLIATNLAVAFAQRGQYVLLVDNDVENPNTNILLGKDLADNDVIVEDIAIFRPVVDTAACTQCGTCRAACYRHAILQFAGQFPTVMDHLCSGCSVCQRVCPANAITPGQRPIGKRYFVEGVRDHVDLLVGELEPSEALSVKIVEDLIAHTSDLLQRNQYDVVIYDSAPGAHCDVEKTLQAAAMIINVTEPTPFGEHDLNRITELLKFVHTPSYLIMNRATLTGKVPAVIVEQYSHSAVEYLGPIDVDPLVIENYAAGRPFVLDPRDFQAKKQFLAIFEKILRILNDVDNGGGF